MDIKLPRLNLPIYNFRYDSRDGKDFIFDPVRRKYVQLTGEEWVRQNFVQFLINEKNYPASRFRVETEIKVQNVRKRCDVVFYDKLMKPFIIAECKAPDVKLDQKTLDQIGAYNSSLKVKYLMITNGLSHFCFEMNYKAETYELLGDLPEYS